MKWETIVQPHILPVGVMFTMRHPRSQVIIQLCSPGVQTPRLGTTHLVILYSTVYTMQTMRKSSHNIVLVRYMELIITNHAEMLITDNDK